MRVIVVFFSPTGNTAQIAYIIEKTLLNQNIEVEMVDITIYSERQKVIEFRSVDLIFFGFPIHVQRVPQVIRDWIQTIDGCGKPCSVFFTYGGVTTGIAHFDTKKRLEQQNFIVVSTAEFLGEHTFNLGGWELLVNHPNEQDFLIAQEYIIKTLEKLKSPNPQKLQFEEPTITERQLNRLDKVPIRGVIPPTRNGKDCSMCMKCENQCPTNAMDAIKGFANGEICIRCLRCVKICPDNILEINDMRPAFSVIAKTDNTNESLSQKTSQFYT